MKELLRFIFAMVVFISTFAIAAHAILCPNDNVDEQLFTRIFTQRWLFLFGYSSYEQFTGISDALWINFHGSFSQQVIQLQQRNRTVLSFKL